MDSINTIITELKSIASELNYNGPAINAIVHLLANAIYKDNVNAINTVLESSLSRCKNINTLIQRAMDEGYSVPRGTNQHITITNLKPTVSGTYAKYSQAAKISNYTLYFADNYNITTDTDENKTIEFVVAKEMYDEELTGSNSIYRFSHNTDLSSDIALYLFNDLTNSWEEISPTNITENRRQLINLNSSQLDAMQLNDPTNSVVYFINTATDYSIRVWKYTRVNTNIELDNIKFNERVKYKCPKYMGSDSEFNPSDIKSIDGFTFDPFTEISSGYYGDIKKLKVPMYTSSITMNASTLITNDTVIKDTDIVYYNKTINNRPKYINNSVVERLESKESILNNILAYKSSNFVVRTNDDLKFIIKDYLMSIPNSTISDAVVDITSDVNGTPKVNVYYTNASTTFNLSDTANEDLESYLNKAYYMTEDVSLYEIGDDEYELIPIKLSLIIKYEGSSIDKDAIKDYIASRQYIISEEFSVGNISRELMTKYSNIRSIDTNTFEVNPIIKVLNSNGSLSTTDISGYITGSTVEINSIPGHRLSFGKLNQSLILEYRTV